MQDDEPKTVLPAGTPCVTGPASGMDLLQIAIKHPSQGWIAVEVDRGTASKLALELQAFADFRSTADEGA